MSRAPRQGAGRGAGAWTEALQQRLRTHRTPLVLLADAAVVALAWQATYLFRLGFERWWSARADYDPLVLAGVVLTYALLGLALGVPRGVWRFSGIGEIQRLALLCALAGALSAAVVLALGLVKVPRSVLALHPVFALMGMALARLAWRAWYEHLQARHAATEARRLLVLGAGESARLVVAGFHRQGWQVVGLLDDDPGRQGARVAGVPVRGRLADVQDQVRRLAPTHLLVAPSEAGAAERRRVLALAATTGLPVLTVPGARERAEAGGQAPLVRAVEPEDLLGRDPVALDEAPVAALVAGRAVMVTGAGGSIGSELCRQLARHRPQRLLLLERSEYALYAIEQELRERHPGLPLVPLLADVTDAAAMPALMQRAAPQLVFHAAAYKHVPLLEHDNAWAALVNNTLGTWRAARAAAAAGVQAFVLVSTDKAVRPSSVMGATKRAAEMALSALVPAHPGTRFVAVRFGNVLGSSGSVIPRFKEQIAAGGPVTVTHPGMLRYFMTIPEAARLVLQAAAVGASGQVMVLEMGEPVRIVELARQLIRLAGHSEDSMPIVYSGLRPGEKLVEELLADEDTTLPTSVPGLRVAQLAQPGPQVQALLAWAETVAAAGHAADNAVRARLKAAVPEFGGAGAAA